jgi:microcystin-dependent protein
MSEPFLGEIRMVGFNFAPQGWALCNGQILSIAQNTALFSLVGTFYGGDGVQTFALPDLRSRIPVHQGSGFVIGQPGGVENVTLTQAQIPSHAHSAQCNTGATQTTTSPAGAVWLNYNQNQYTTQATPATMNAGAVANAGGNQPHNNLMPYLAVNFVIALTGIFPSRN